MSIRIKYCGPVYDPSGYGEFSRTFIRALHAVGAQVQVEPVSFDKARPDLGEIGALCKMLERPFAGGLTADVKIINVTPQHYERLREPGCLNVGFTMFETTRIPDAWVQDCNYLDAILVPCAWNRQVFEDSGVTVPVRVAAPGIDLGDGAELKDDVRAPHDWFGGASVLYDGAFRAEDFARSYKFYSVFQWTERKNPIGLLKAYFAEFHRDDGVCLVLKTYRSSVSKLQQNVIKLRIRMLKRTMTLERFPPIVFVGGLLSRSQLKQLHRSCDCFVLPHRAEGFGLPHLEAMAEGKPVITTGFSGNMEFTTHENSRLLPYQLTPVAGMQWIPWYEGDMMWAEPDLGALRQNMRELYEDRAAGEELGRRAYTHVREEFNWRSRAEHLLRILDELTALPRTKKAS